MKKLFFLTAGIFCQKVPKYWQYLGLDKSDYGQGNIVNNWILEVIDSGFKVGIRNNGFDGNENYEVTS